MKCYQAYFFNEQGEPSTWEKEWMKTAGSIELVEEVFPKELVCSGCGEWFATLNALPNGLCKRCTKEAE